MINNLDDVKKKRSFSLEEFFGVYLALVLLIVWIFHVGGWKGVLSGMLLFAMFAFLIWAIQKGGDYFFVAILFCFIMMFPIVIIFSFFD